MKQLTIGMPVYNGAATIAAALDSLLAQTFADFDLIISDNGSTDATQAICEFYAERDSRVRYVRQTANLGPQMNFRFVLFEGQTRYFMWAAADDFWAPIFIERNIAILESNPDVVMSQTQVIFTEKGKVSHLATGTYALLGTPRRNAARFFQNPADNSRFYGIFRTEALRRSYPTRPFHALDWAVSAGTLRFGKHHEIAELLMLRDSSDPISYQRAILNDHRFVLWRIFPALFMTKWILANRVVPFSPELLHRLFRLNLYMHFRFGIYRFQSVGQRYIASHSLTEAFGLSPLKTLIGRLHTRLQRVARAAWQRLPLSLPQRQSVKMQLFRLLGSRAGALKSFQGWGPLPSPTPPEPNLGEEWKRLAIPPKAPVLSVILLGEGGPGGALLAFSCAALLRQAHEVEIIWVLPRGEGLGVALVAGLPGIHAVELEPEATLGAQLNAGAAAATTERLFFVPATAIFGLDLVPNLVDALATANLVTPMILRADGRIEAAGGYLSRSEGLVRRGVGEEATAPAHGFVDTCDVALGALAVTREAMPPNEPFDPALDDLDLLIAKFCLGLRHLQGGVLYWPWLRITVAGPAGTPNSAPWRALAERYGEERLRTSEASSMPDGCTSAPLRVLYIDADTPQPDRNSGSIDAVNMMRLLKRLGAEITFIPESNFAYRGAYSDALCKLGVRVIYYPNFQNVEQVLQQEDCGFDVVFLCRAYIADRYLTLVRQMAPLAKIVFYTVDLHFLREEREAQISGSPKMMAAAAVSKSSELASIRGSDATIVLSTYERDLLKRQVPGAQINVIPLLRDIPAQLDAPGPEYRRDVMFVGTYQHPPNVDAAMFFAREVWPLVRKRLPGARFLVVGSSVTPEIAALSAEEGIDVLGFVQDLEALMSRVRVSVAPLRYGAGLKGKIASALEAGLPTVATSIAAEGVTLTHGHDILIADTPEEIADAVTRLYQDDALWQKLACNGFEFVRREYSLEENEPRIAELLQELGVESPLISLRAMEHDLARGDPVFRPSEFWSKLIRHHLDDFLSGRVLRFKRTINNCYMQWMPGSFDDPRLTLPFADFTARPSMIPIEVAAEVPPQPELAGEVVGFNEYAPFADKGYLRFYAFYTGLIWQSMTRHATDGLHTWIEEPALGAPIALRYQGRPISQDLANSLLEYYRIKELVRQIEMPKRITYLELGAGYGRLAYVFLNAQPCRYIIVDIAPAILVAKWYLTTLFPDRAVFGYRAFRDFAEVRDEVAAADIVFLSPNQLALLPDNFFDVAISVSTLHEMTLAQIERYKELISVKTSRAVYFKQWTSWQNPEDDIHVGSDLYMFLPPWRLVLDATDLTNCEFTEQGWHRDNDQSAGEVPPPAAPPR
ncbi:MAG: putative sugar O-methyltransferase [Roseomonas sp.]|nr:putative sugar O-methyltransferase [Roseomonas sp.]